ncbi:DUF1499 domain-containing protein [Tepidamorphus sp. 3E244]|uniref:DUF1499 domain-containing protein n=1 Tax=Tepidamorphus sp. 3E244 TaxID=3385498 RepID=UPI0038FBFA48
MSDETIIDIMDRRAIEHDAGRVSAAGIWARRLGALSIPVVIIAGLMHRFGHLDTPTLIGSIGLATILALLALAMAIATIVTVWSYGWRGLGDAGVGVIYALCVLALPAWAGVAYIDKPMITDVTTDPRDPPAMPAAQAQRPALSNPVRYNEELVAVQRIAYPQIVPLRAVVPPPNVYEVVLDIVESMDWLVLDSHAPQDGLSGGVEALVHSPVFGFPNDVSIRISYEGDNTVIDMRARSRFGKHDLGYNAKLIDNFLTELATRLSVPGA